MDIIEPHQFVGGGLCRNTNMQISIFYKNRNIHKFEKNLVHLDNPKNNILVLLFDFEILVVFFNTKKYKNHSGA